MEMTPPRAGDHARMMLGALVLGVLSPEDEGIVRRHLEQCEQCRTEYLELADVPSWLNLITEAEAAASVPEDPDEARLEGLITDLAVRRRTAQRARRLGAAAAVAAVLATGIWAVTGQSGPASADVPIAAHYSAHMVQGNQQVSADVGLTPKNWGTLIQATFDNLPPGLNCQLVAVGRDGTTEVASTWISRAAVTLPGSISLPMDQITSFRVQAIDGNQTDHIMTIPVASAPSASGSAGASA